MNTLEMNCKRLEVTHDLSEGVRVVLEGRQRRAGRRGLVTPRGFVKEG